MENQCGKRSTESQRANTVDAPHVIKLSIIIPAIGEQADIDATLLSVLENLPAECEVILACRTSYQDPYDLQDEIHFVEVDNKASVLDLINAGIRASEGDIVHWILPGVVATPGWTDAATERFERDDDTTCVSPLLVRGTAPDVIVAAGLIYRSAGIRKVVGRGKKIHAWNAQEREIHGATINSGFCRRDTFCLLGGFSNRFEPTTADVDFAIRLEEHGTSVTESNSVLIAHRDDDARPSFRNARSLEKLFWKHYPNRGRTFARVLHAFHAIFSSLMLFPRTSAISTFVGRRIGRIEAIRATYDDASWPTDDSVTLPLRPSEPNTSLLLRRAA